VSKHPRTLLLTGIDCAGCGHDVAYHLPAVDGGTLCMALKDGCDCERFKEAVLTAPAASCARCGYRFQDHKPGWHVPDICDHFIEGRRKPAAGGGQ
jgi:hypothetical protein